MSPEPVFIGLGGNLGDPGAAMGAALRALDAAKGVAVAAVSSLYRTPPWGKTDQPDFLNAVAELRTRLEPREILELCLEAERALKRVRGERWGPRLIDLDVLLFGTRSIKEHGLEVPHPRLSERAFVLVPLAEIAPGLPVGGRSVEDWLSLIDAAGIEKLPGGSDWWREQA